VAPARGRVDGEAERHRQVAPRAAGVVEDRVLLGREEPVVAEDVVLGSRPEVVEKPQPGG